MTAPGSAPDDPFLDDRHRALAERARAFGDKHLRSSA